MLNSLSIIVKIFIRTGVSFNQINLYFYFDFLLVKTRITREPNRISRKVGTKIAMLYCDAEYEKELKSLDVTFQWLLNGKPFVSNERVYLERRLEGPQRLLFLKDLQLSDAGEYGCRVFTKEKDTRIIISEDRKIGAVYVIGLLKIYGS